VGAGPGVGVVGGAADELDAPPPPQLRSRSAPAMATPMPTARDLFMTM